MDGVDIQASHPLAAGAVRGGGGGGHGCGWLGGADGALEAGELGLCFVLEVTEEATCPPISISPGSDRWRIRVDEADRRVVSGVGGGGKRGAAVHGRLGPGIAWEAPQADIQPIGGKQPSERLLKLEAAVDLVNGMAWARAV